jgi:hypothetical protein
MKADLAPINLDTIFARVKIIKHTGRTKKQLHKKEGV